MSRIRLLAPLAVLAWLSLAAPLGAQDPHDTSPPTAETASPFRTSDLIYAGLFFGSLAAVYPLQEVEEGLSPEQPPGGFPGTLFDAGNTAGNGFVAYALSGATFLTGKAIANHQVARIGVRSLEALVLADLIVFPFKVTVGRRRPEGIDPDADELDPFTYSKEYYSFPSGHAAHAFAIASTLSRELGHQAPWVPYVAYGAAGLTAVSRVATKRHWVTDVTAGAAAGLFAGHFVGRLHDEERVGAPVTPVLSVDDGGVYLGAVLSVR